MTSEHLERPVFGREGTSALDPLRTLGIARIAAGMDSETRRSWSLGRVIAVGQWFLFSIVTLLGGSTYVVASTTSVIVPGLRPGEAYSKSRGDLVRAGWRPVKTRERLGDGTLAKMFGDAGEMVRNGYAETFDCSGTGLNFCRFVWKRGPTCIHVTTQGEYVPERGSPIVYRVVFGDCAGPRQ